MNEEGVRKCDGDSITWTPSTFRTPGRRPDALGFGFEAQAGGDLGAPMLVSAQPLCGRFTREVSFSFSVIPSRGLTGLGWYVYTLAYLDLAPAQRTGEPSLRSAELNTGRLRAAAISHIHMCDHSPAPSPLSL
jgi:hypothetical protein